MLSLPSHTTHNISISYSRSHGFLPFKGLEIPIMALQSKVFIITMLQRFSPHISRKRTFIRRVKERLTITKGESSSADSLDLEMGVSPKSDSGLNKSHKRCSSHDSSKSLGDDSNRRELTTSEAMKLFTKIPFPEPRLALYVNERKRDDQP